MASNTTSVRTLPARPSLESLRKQAKTLGRKVAADVNTDWATHEPASILHECALHGDFEGARFLIAHGIDLTIRDHRRDGTAADWAWHAANDQAMCKMLTDAEEERKSS
jgi:hypothetical protein